MTKYVVGSIVYLKSDGNKLCPMVVASPLGQAPDEVPVLWLNDSYNLQRDCFHIDEVYK